jgi:hypothetical protein
MACRAHDSMRHIAMCVRRNNPDTIPRRTKFDSLRSLNAYYHKMTTAIIFISGSTLGDALGSTGRLFRKVFEALGHEFIEVDFSKPGAGDLLNQVIRTKRIQFAFSFAGMGVAFETEVEGGIRANLWQTLNVPFISLNGDSPAYFFDRHVMPGSTFACIYGFPEHCDLRRRLPSVAGLLGVAPHVLLHPTPKAAIDFTLKSRGKLLFLKNGNDPEQLLLMWRDNFSPGTFLMLADLAGELARSIHTESGNDIDKLVVDYFCAKGMDVAQLAKLRLFFVAQLDDYLRRLKSTMIVEALLDFPIEVHGFNWEHIDFQGRRALLIPTADYTRSTDLIRNALGVIDMSPNTALAPHDRPMRAFGMHTLCLTNEQIYFQRKSPLYKEFSFQFSRESIKQKVAEVLANPGRFVEIGIEIAESFGSGHEPEIFGQWMLDVAHTLTLQGAPRFPGLQPYFAWPPSSLT